MHRTILAFAILLFGVAATASDPAAASVKALALSPTQIDFGERDILAGPAPAQMVTVTNTGDAPVTIDAAMLVGAPDANECAFPFDHEAAITVLEPGATLSLPVAFDPGFAVSQHCVLQLFSDVDAAPEWVVLTGTGTSATGISVSPKEFDFGWRRIDAGKSAPQKFTIENLGSATLTIDYVVVELVDAEFYVDPAPSCDFVVESDSGEDSLAPGEQRLVEISFDPTREGGRACQLRVRYSGPEFGSTAAFMVGLGSTVDDPVFGDGFDGD